MEKPVVERMMLSIREMIKEIDEYPAEKRGINYDNVVTFVRPPLKRAMYNLNFVFQSKDQ